MTKNLWEFFAVLSILTLTIVACNGKGYKLEKTAGSIQIAVAADFAETAKLLGGDFTARTGITVVVNSDSSGALVSQIRSGAVFDAFLSANTDFPRQLVTDGLAVPEPVVYAVGKLALYSPEHDLSTNGAALLASGTFPRLAVADPQTAPYGRAAIQTLEKLGLADQLKKTLVYGENVGKTLKLVETGKADAGFVAFPDIGSNRKQAWVVPDDMHAPIEQAAVVLSTTQDSESVDSWMKYLLSDPARLIIQDEGYRLP
jgi:molybdate transport system substrate-binding protein